MLRLKLNLFRCLSPIYRFPCTGPLRCPFLLQVIVLEQVLRMRSACSVTSSCLRSSLVEIGTVLASGSSTIAAVKLQQLLFLAAIFDPSLHIPG